VPFTKTSADHAFMIFAHDLPPTAVQLVTVLLEVSNRHSYLQVLSTWASTLHVIFCTLFQSWLAHVTLMHCCSPFSCSTIKTPSACWKSYHWFEIHSTELKVVSLLYVWTQYYHLYSLENNNCLSIFCDIHSILKNVIIEPKAPGKVT